MKNQSLSLGCLQQWDLEVSREAFIPYYGPTELMYPRHSLCILKRAI